MAILKKLMAILIVGGLLIVTGLWRFAIWIFGLYILIEFIMYIISKFRPQDYDDGKR